MAKKETQTEMTPMKGEVNRGIDFNLKKEDLMLLIIEGRKEVMEEELTKRGQVISEMEGKLADLQKKLKDKVRDLIFKSFTPEVKTMLEEHRELEKEVNLDLNQFIEGPFYTEYYTGKVGEDGKSGSVIKMTRTNQIALRVYSTADATLYTTGNKKTYVRKSDIFKGQPESYNSSGTINLLSSARLDTEYQKETAEYKEMEKLAKQLVSLKSDMSDLTSEYDLFTRNQPRSKAKMIKEVLQRDEAGLAMLENIAQAAKGVKLLS